MCNSEVLGILKEEDMRMVQLRNFSFFKINTFHISFSYLISLENSNSNLSNNFIEGLFLFLLIAAMLKLDLLLKKYFKYTIDASVTYPFL